MSVINAGVTAGKVFVKDANGEVLVAIDDLNSLGVPTVTVTLTGVVATADLVDGNVTAAKLADALADALRTAVATVGDEAANVVTVTIQFKDAQGNNVAERCVFQYWLSDAANGAPTSTVPSGGVSVSTGVEIVALANDVVSMVETDANGTAVLAFTEVGALTRYFNLVVLNDLVAGSQALTWT